LKKGSEYKSKPNFSTYTLYGIVSIIDYKDSLFHELGEAISVGIPFHEKELHLELLEVSSAFYNYRVVTSDERTLSSNKDIKHYRGIVRDDPNSIVAISFLRNEVIGLVATEEGNLNLGLDINGRHIFYNDKNLITSVPLKSGRFKN